jgi:hypothetical protein
MATSTLSTPDVDADKKENTNVKTPAYLLIATMVMVLIYALFVAICYFKSIFIFAPYKTPAPKDISFFRPIGEKIVPTDEKLKNNKKLKEQL